MPIPTSGVVLIILAALCSSGFAQQPTAAQEPQQSLKIFILEGQGAINAIRARTATMVVVEVRDPNDQPVEGADVAFELPMVGPGGSFAGQQNTHKTRTNLQGQAAASFTPNAETGRFHINVTATLGNRLGRAVVSQTNALAAPRGGERAGLLKFRWWKVALLAGGGGALAAGILATRGGSSSATPSATIPTITLIPGPPSFNGPR